MGLRESFRPKLTISDQDLASGLRWLTWEGTTAMGFFSITTSGFLAACVAEGALDASAAMGAEAVAKVKAFLPEGVLPADLAEREK